MSGSHLVTAPTVEVTARATPIAAVTRNVRALLGASFLTLLVAVFGIFARLQILADGMARPNATNIFYRLYALHEGPFLIVLTVTAVAMMLVCTRRHASQPSRDTWWDCLTVPTATAMRVAALTTFVATVLTAYLVLHAYPFAMDEFSADFQARIFAHGGLVAALPIGWRPFAPGMTPIFVAYDAIHGSWLSAYLPVYALLKSPFVALGLGAMLNPLLAAISILVLAAIARQLWPNESLRPWVAIAFLATSSQFVVTSGTAYSMSAHLCLNLIWLWLYLRDDSRSFAAALVVGMLALGLHNPFPHALFVAPFLIRLLRDRRWVRVAAAAAAYGSASILWFFWIRFTYTHTAGAGEGGLVDLFAVPTLSVLWVHGINVSLLFTWQAPLLGLLAVAALLQPSKLASPLRDLGWGIAITLAFYTFFPRTQGHGWGYRYAYQVIGSLALLAAAGSAPLREALGRVRATRLLVASFIVALVVQLPIRIIDVERFIRPFAAGAEFVRTRSADVVLVHGDSIWYGRDLVRNDPFLRGQPVVLRADGLSPRGRAVLEQRYPGRVIEVSDTELLRLGMTPWTNHPF
jgi:hypothetical protein